MASASVFQLEWEMKRFLTFGLMVGLAVAIGCDQSETPPALAEALSAPVTNLSDGPLVGSVAPDIVGVDLEGVEFKLSDYKGQVIMLDFYGDW